MARVGDTQGGEGCETAEVVVVLKEWEGQGRESVGMRRGDGEEGVPVDVTRDVERFQAVARLERRGGEVGVLAGVPDERLSVTETSRCSSCSNASRA